MKYSEAYIPTRKEDPAEAELISHKLMLRGGFMRQVSAGIYSFLPLGWRVVRKVSQIVRHEMDRAGALEVMLPSVQPASLWQQSGRWDFYGPELLRFRDRKGNDYCYGPTHEEVMVDLIRDELRSYRQLPLCLYQIQTKFRDEIRPRAGLMRGREFIMKDAYSFDMDQEGAQLAYQKMYDAYGRIFTRCGFDFRPVEADTGNIGGSMSHEFQVLAETGEDAIVSCPSCKYTANVELAEITKGLQRSQEPDQWAALEPVETPDQRTVQEVTAFLGVGPEKLAKTMIYMVDGQATAVMVRGDAEANEVKIRKALGAQEVRIADDEEVRAATGAPVGFAGPVGLSVPVFADNQIGEMYDFVVGGNQADLHHVGVNWGRDFEPRGFVDVRMAQAGDLCGRCGSPMNGYRGIEVGHVFFLGTKYSNPMKACFLNADGESQPFYMGCYGIGITRIVSAAIEQHHDKDGIVWPMSLAPYQVVILPLQVREPEVMEQAHLLYESLLERGIEVIMDDRDERPGFKFKDADLLGFPLRLTVSSRNLKEGVVELKDRGASQAEKLANSEVVEEVVRRVSAALATRKRPTPNSGG